MNRFGLHAVWLFGVFLSSVVALAEGEHAFIEQAESGLVIGNEWLEIHFDTSKGRPTATSLVNKVSGSMLSIGSDDFSLGVEGREPLRAANFTLKESRKEDLPGGGKRLRLPLAGQASAGDLEIVYELGDADFFLRRRLELKPNGPLPLRKVDAWLVGVEGTCSHEGYGEPVLLDDTFWGLEFPGSHNRYLDGVVTLSHHPGRTVADRFVSKSAVLGVARPGHVARQFQTYVKTFQATPPETKLFVNYNTWWTLMPPTEENCRELIATFKQNLFDPFGESFDTFTIDDGWDDKNSLWKIREDRFPEGFRPLTEPLRAMSAEHGLWLSPSSGYSHTPWGARAGYEHNSNEWFLCQSGPKYRRDIVQVVTDLAKQYGMAFFKFDGFCADCDAEGHGHLPGEYAKEANIDAFIELLQAVRQVRSNVFLDPTCGIWLSPWWLAYADSLWGSVSGDYPDIIVPAPVLRDSATTTRDAVFRDRCREHPGYPPAAIEHLGIIVITPEKWEDNAMIVLGRGCRLLTLYINPKFFQNGERDWAFLASILKWVRHHAQTLENTELILGDPLAREPYGYAHFDGPNGIVALRNPFIEPQTVQLVLDESLGLVQSDAVAPNQDALALCGRIVYPYCQTVPEACRYGAAVDLKLQGYETVILEIEPRGRDKPLPDGVRCVELERSGNRITFDVFGRPGQAFELPASDDLGPFTKVLFDGQPAAIGQGQPSAKLPLEFPGSPQTCSVEAPPMKVEMVGDAWQLTGTCVAEVPQGSKATMHVLLDPRGSALGEVQCTASVEGKPVDVRAVHPPAQPQQTHGSHSWTWLEFDVPEGRSEVALAITLGDGVASFFRGGVGWWLWVEHPEQKATLTVEYEKPLPLAPEDPLPLPIGLQSEREIITVQPARLFRTGRRWPKSDQPVVHLDEVVPDEVVQEWGRLRRNQSVWEKEMIIAGQKFARGLGTHANARILYELSGGNFIRFRATVGRDEHSGDGRIVFQVWVDGKSRFDSGPMTKNSLPQTADVDLAGAKVLELRTLDGGDGINGDHGNWADAQLLR